MHTRSLVLVLLRIFAIYWVMQSVSQFGALLPWFFMNETRMSVNPAAWSILITPGVILILAIALWLFAGGLSNVFVRGHDAELSTVTLTREDLYSFAFVFLGLYFVLSSVSGAIEVGQRFLTNDALLPETDPRHGKELAPFLGRVLTLMMGFASILGASKWSRLVLKNNTSRD